MGANPTPQKQGTESKSGLRLAARSGLDMMLTDAVLEDGGVGRFLNPRAADDEFRTRRARWVFVWELPAG
jgi:hypothetical protein